MEIISSERIDEGSRTVFAGRAEASRDTSALDLKTQGPDMEEGSLVLLCGAAEDRTSDWKS